MARSRLDAVDLQLLIVKNQLFNRLNSVCGPLEFGHCEIARVANPSQHKTPKIRGLQGALQQA